MTCTHIQGGHYQVIDGGCVLCWKDRAEKAEAALSAIPSTFYIGLPPVERLKLLAECWINAVVINQKLQDKLDRYEREHPTICYQCGKPDKARVLVEVLEKARDCLRCLNAYDYPSRTKRSEVINPVLGSISGFLDAVKDTQ